MKQVLVILEQDVINGGFYLGKSGDFAVVEYFLRHNFEVFVCSANCVENDLANLPVLNVVNKNYTHNYLTAILNECENIISKKTPGFGMTQEMCVKFEFESADFNELKNGAMLFSRAMPQSLTEMFLHNFKILAETFKTVQNMEEIVLYKDKAIPFLLQENNEIINELGRLYDANVLQFKNEISRSFCHNLAIDSLVIDIDQDFELNFEKIKEFAKFAICVKPFNLFGGVGVGIFQNANKELMRKHLELIKGKFVEYGVVEKHLVLVQRAVGHPEFGDIRAIFSHGKFVGAFKRWEPKNFIHNTMNGAIIVPVCNGDFVFFKTFEETYHNAFKEAITHMTQLNKSVDCLQKEVFYGGDLLLDETDGKFQFKLTEINIACPTGFAFLESSLICNSGFELNFGNIEKYYEEKGKIIDLCFAGLGNYILTSH